MKKLIIALIFLIIVIGLGVFEIYFSKNKYNKIYDNLTSLSQIVHANEKNTNVKDVQDKIDTLKEDWNNSKKFFLLVTNHNITKQIDQQMTSIETTSKENAFEDLCLYISTLQKLIETQKNELYPKIDNLF